VVNKIWVLSWSDIINGRCDIFAAPVHRFERREIGSRVLATDVILDVSASLKGY
jgi:hypothetical protein